MLYVILYVIYGVTLFCAAYWIGVKWRSDDTVTWITEYRLKDENIYHACPETSKRNAYDAANNLINQEPVTMVRVVKKTMVDEFVWAKGVK